MRTPPFLLGAAIVFWGWQVDALLFALLMVPVMESARLIRTRWVLSLSDFYRISDIATLILLGVAMYVLFTNPRSIVMLTVKWLPLITFPLLAAQEYSTVGKIDTRTFLMLARKETTVQDNPSAIDFSYPYFILCIVAAASANQRTNLFYIGFVLLAAWALFPYRSRKYPISIWCGLMLMSGALGYAGHMGLNQMQGFLMNWTSDLFLTDSNPFKSTTAIGEIGQVKQSSRIVYRVELNTDGPAKILMREASYHHYLSSTWFAGRSEQKEIQPENNGNTWKLGPVQNTADRMTVSAYLSEGRGMLKLPIGAFAIESSLGLRLQKNDLGAVMAEDGPGLIQYAVRYGEVPADDRLPDDQDLSIPQGEMPGITQFITALGLSGRPPDEIQKLLQAFFQEKFTYTLDLDDHNTDRSPISRFLLFSRSGHCEYFATATVLVLRACGIPARYAKGHLAHEYSAIENRIIVRSRHAHAWALVYTNGKWSNFDTTPSAWISTEEERMSRLHIISDLFSYAVFAFSKWRWSMDSTAWKNYSLILLLPLGIILIRRIYSRKKIQRITLQTGRKKTAKDQPGDSTEFNRIEKKLTELGFQRHPWETMQSWIERIKEPLQEIISPAALTQALQLHYRSRFDHQNLNQEEKKELIDQVAGILKKMIRYGKGTN